MENTTFTQSNYRQDYNTFQLFLPLDLSVNIPEDDIVFIYVEILKGVDLTKYIVFYLKEVQITMINFKSKLSLLCHDMLPYFLILN